MSMKYDVFISYSRKDYVDSNQNLIPGNIVSKIKEFLQANNFTYWFDEEGIYSGDSFTEIIAGAIQDSEIFLFISTEASNASKWTTHELAVAKHLGKKTIPFRVDNSKYGKSILLYLAPLDYIDYEKNPNKAFDSLLATINHHFNQKHKAEEIRKLKKEQELKEKERAEEARKAEKIRLARLVEIDVEIANLQVEVDKLEANKLEIKAKINSLNEQILHHEAEMSSLNSSQNEINASIKKLEYEKKSLSKDSTPKQEVKKNINTQKEEAKVADSDKHKDSASRSFFKYILGSFFKYIKDIKKRYWFHLLFILGLTTVTFYFIFIFIFYDVFFALLIALCGSISIYGVIQLLKGKKDGLVALLLNSITFYIVCYLESQFLVYAYIILTIYLFFISLLYLMHKSDKDSPLSWSKMTASKLKRPKKILIWTAISCVISSFAIPYIYAQKCGMRYYKIEDADRVLICCIRGILGNGYSAEYMGDVYIPHDRSNCSEVGYLYGFCNFEPDAQKALWWYELAESNGNLHVDVDSKITYCKEYIEAKESGHAKSDIYGKCGIDKFNGNLVRISVDSYSDGVYEGVYSGSKLQSNLNYYISLINGDLSQGKLEIEGAYLGYIDYNKQKLYNIQGDTVKLKFIQEGAIISERIIPVTKVMPKK